MINANGSQTHEKILIGTNNKILQIETIMTRTLFNCEIGEEKKKLTFNAGKGMTRSPRCRGVCWFGWYRKQLDSMLYHQE